MSSSPLPSLIANYLPSSPLVMVMLLSKYPSLMRQETSAMTEEVTVKLMKNCVARGTCQLSIQMLFSRLIWLNSAALESQVLMTMMMVSVMAMTMIVMLSIANHLLTRVQWPKTIPGKAWGICKGRDTGSPCELP